MELPFQKDAIIEVGHHADITLKMLRSLEGFDHFKLVKLVCDSLISWNMEEGKKEASNPKESPRHLFRPNCKKEPNPTESILQGFFFSLLTTHLIKN